MLTLPLAFSRRNARCAHRSGGSSPLSAGSRSRAGFAAAGKAGTHGDRALPLKHPFFSVVTGPSSDLVCLSPRHVQRGGSLGEGRAPLVRRYRAGTWNGIEIARHIRLTSPDLRSGPDDSRTPRPGFRTFPAPQSSAAATIRTSAAIRRSFSSLQKERLAPTRRTNPSIDPGNCRIDKCSLTSAGYCAEPLAGVVIGTDDFSPLQALSDSTPAIRGRGPRDVDPTPPTPKIFPSAIEAGRGAEISPRR